MKAVKLTEIDISQPGYYLVFTEKDGTLDVIEPHNIAVPTSMPNLPIAGTSTTLGLFGATPVPQQSGFTQTYNTAAVIVNPASTVDFTGIDKNQAGLVYAQVSDLNTLRADVIQAFGLINSLVDILKSYGLTA